MSHCATPPQTASTRDRVRKLAAERRPDFCLQQEFYTDPAIFELDLERIFMRHWLLVGHVAQIPDTGDYFLYEIGRESLIIVRDRAGEVHALYNVCRHRGSRVCLDPSGHAGALVCPYHGWSYAHDGSLRAALAMPEGFDKSQYGLIRCPARVFHGMIYVYLGEGTPPDFESIERDVDPFLAPHELTNAKLCHRMTWEIQANWKLVVENFAECYHCRAAHPEYCSVMAHALPGATGAPPHVAAYDAQVADWEAKTKALGHFTGLVAASDKTLHCASRIPIGDGGQSQSEGGVAVAPLMGRYQQNDGGITSARIHPASYVIAPCDYAIVIRFTPLSVRRTLQEILWLVSPDAREGADYERDRITWLWQVTTDQDQQIIEANQQGVESRVYTPGPYATVEDTVNRFVVWYLREVTG